MTRHFFAPRGGGAAQLNTAPRAPRQNPALDTASRRERTNIQPSCDTGRQPPCPMTSRRVTAIPASAPFHQSIDVTIAGFLGLQKKIVNFFER